MSLPADAGLVQLKPIDNRIKKSFIPKKKGLECLGLHKRNCKKRNSDEK